MIVSRNAEDRRQGAVGAVLRDGKEDDPERHVPRNAWSEYSRWRKHAKMVARSRPEPSRFEKLGLQVEEPDSPNSRSTWA